MRVTSREYKVMLDTRLLLNRKRAAAALGKDLRSAAARLTKVRCEREFDRTQKRTITFLDTRDHTIALNGLILRQRIDHDSSRTEYTLKCRSADRYVAAGAEVRPNKRLKGKTKFEEDIGAPFVPRFSHSCTISPARRVEQRLAGAAKLFPVLESLRRDGEVCAGSLKLQPVQATCVFERILTGPILRFDGTNSEVALILWSDGRKGRPLVAELSFRYGHDDEAYSVTIARLAMAYFLDFQRLDWCQPTARTKTQFAYGK